MLNRFASFFKTRWSQVILVLLLANGSLFYKFYLLGLLPFPGDLLVAFYFPWNSGGFTGYDSWTPHKNSIAADVVRQIYPWKELVVDLFKNFQIPLWNPYNFSGTPLLANLQSSVFFPGNLLFFIFPFLHSWIFLVCFTLSLFSLFTYLFLRSLKISHYSAMFGMVCAGGMSYFLVWQEQLVIIQSALFLPLILFLVNKYCDDKKSTTHYLIPILIAFTVFGGHIQTSTYVLIAVAVYMFYKNTGLIFLARNFIIGLMLSAIQILPSAQLYLLSAREVPANKYLFDAGILPLVNIVTFLVPDFFGNPATANFWGKDYGNFQAFFGVGAFILSVYSLFLIRLKEVRFWVIFFAVTLFFSMYPSHIFEILKIPVLSSSAPARLLFLTQFSGVLLASFGLDYLISVKGKMQLSHWVVPALPIIITLGLILVTYITKNPYLLVSRNNLKLPFLISITMFCGLVIYSRSKKNLVRLVLATFLILGVCIEYSYFFNKYSPFSTVNFVYPMHPVVTFLKDKAGLNRFYGYWSSYIENNFSTEFRTYSTEGYDSLYIKRYGELLASAKDGKYHVDLQRSDANFTQEDTIYRRRLFDLLGIKYVLDKNDAPSSNWEPEPLRFPDNDYSLFWQVYKWKGYERKSVLPRAMLFGSYEVVTGEEKILEKLYSPNFDYRHKLILETDPKFTPNQGEGSVEILTYSPNNIVLRTRASQPKLLFLSDTYYPGWKAFVDNAQAPIYRADYAMRAVIVEAGEHRVVFNYDPPEFKVGFSISFFALILLASLYLRSKHES